MEQFAARYLKLVESLSKYWTFSEAETAKGPRRRVLTSSAPFMNAVYDAAQYTDGTDPHYTFIIYRPGEARDLPVFLHGNVATPGEIVRRHFPTVLSRDDGALPHGSGRLDLAERIFTDSAPLAARVMVNRVWGWHFGDPLVASPSDFGVQGEKPTDPELLDDLAARFIAHGWSLKWLHREIMQSAAYRQSSQPRAGAQQLDPANLLLWRMTPRRLDVESYRDSLLRAAGLLSDQMYGPSEDLDAEGNVRRTVYARISRRRLSNLLRQYDFPDPIQTSPGRDLTTSSLQQLFVMNSAFMHNQGEAVAGSAANLSDEAQKIRFLYHRILARDPSPKECDLASGYLRTGTLAQYAQILLSTNEEIFWP
jgi:hypothetical protein